MGSGRFIWDRYPKAKVPRYPMWTSQTQACVTIKFGTYILYHSWQHTWVVHMSLQTNDKVAFEEIPVTYSAHPYLFVLVLFLEAVVLLHVYVAFNIFYLHIVHVARIFVGGGGGGTYPTPPSLHQSCTRLKLSRTDGGLWALQQSAES